jgi:hypothetical protein
VLEGGGIGSVGFGGFGPPLTMLRLFAYRQIVLLSSLTPVTVTRKNGFGRSQTLSLLQACL